MKGNGTHVYRWTAGDGRGAGARLYGSRAGDGSMVIAIAIYSYRVLLSSPGPTRANLGTFHAVVCTDPQDFRCQIIQARIEL